MKWFTESSYKTAFLSFFTWWAYLLNGQVPGGFVDISQVNSSITIEQRYFSNNNFVGDTIDGYQASVLYLSSKAAMALDNVHNKLSKKGIGLKLFDGYRPQTAVDHFVRWAKDLEDTLMKQTYYPNVEKSELFEKGYIASRSGHSRGSTVDLTLIYLASKEELDMGSSYDLFDPISHHNTDKIRADQEVNRKLLKEAMELYGFKAYRYEWWHYTLINEPFPDTYFNFIIK